MTQFLPRSVRSRFRAARYGGAALQLLGLACCASLHACAGAETDSAKTEASATATDSATTTLAPSDSTQATPPTATPPASTPGPTANTTAPSQSSAPTTPATSPSTVESTPPTAATTGELPMASTSTGTTPDTTATATPGTGGADGMGGAPASSGGTDGMGGAGGAGTAGPPSAVWACPAGITGTPTLTGTPTRVAAVPPADDFNMQNGTWGNVEGPVWVGDALYMSEMSSTPYEPANSDQKKSRLLKLAADGTVSIVMADSGSNGLAVDDAGNLVAGVQKDGSITRFSLSGGEPTVLASMYMGKRFNSPNDLALRSDGTLYFSDPRFNAPSSPPQAQTYVYRLPAGGEAEPIPSAASPQMFDGPNGVMLSLAEDYLYVAASAGKRFAVMADGSIGAGEDFPATNGGDGMGIDCAGNIYVAESNTPNLHVFTAEGDAIGSLVISEFQGVTNVAFGGPEHKTLFVTGHGNGKGLFTLDVGIQGRPY